jgi:hypothetical protein
MNHQRHPFQRKPKSISSFIARYKSNHASAITGAVLKKIDEFIDERDIPERVPQKPNPYLSVKLAV